MAPASPRRRSARGPAAQTGLPDEMWWEILLRLDAAADLARASAACYSFRRIVAEHRFLRRFRSLHSPPILGFIRKDRHGFVPVDAPHRSAPEARALDQASDFTFSFLPDPSAWRSCDARDDRVLLSRRIDFKTKFRDFIVCDPLHRRYVKIPRIPDDLMASIPHTGTWHLLPVLAPADHNDGEESFRVICTVQLKLENKVMAFVFTSCNQTWQAIISTISLPNRFIGFILYYAHGSLYWMFRGICYSLKLDISELKFSIIDLPPHNFHSKCAIVEMELGRLGFLTIGYDTIGLYCKNRQSSGVGAQEWQYDRLIPLPKDSGINYAIWSIAGTVGHYLALAGYRQVSHELRKCEYFVLDTKTLLLDKVCALSNSVIKIPYARFPPPFALPSV